LHLSWATFRPLRLQLVTAFVLVTALVWLAIAYQVRSAHDDALESARRHGDNLSGVVAGHFSSFARTLDSWLQDLRVEWRDDPAHFADTMAREERLLENAFIIQVSVIDAQGWTVYQNHSPTPGRVFVGDREYFKAHLESGLDRLDVGKLVKDSRSGEVLIPFSRPVYNRKGEFSGVMALFVSPRELNRIYQRIDLGRDGIVTLRKRDGTVMARSPDFEEFSQRPLPPGHDYVADTREVGSHVSQGSTDGVERIFNFRRLKDYSLIAVVAQSTDTALADYYNQRRVYFAGGVFMSVVLFLLMLVVIAKLKREERAGGELRTSEERFRSLTELSSDVYWEQDRLYRFTSFIGKGLKWIDAERLIGKKRWDQVYLNMSAADWAAHIAMLDARQSFRDLELCRFNGPGRKIWISVSGEPIFEDSGAFKGYRGVTKDTTERKRLEELRALEHVVSRSLADADSVTKAVQAAVRAICKTEGWECGRYFRWDDKAEMLRFADAWGISDDAVQQFLAESRELSYAPGVGLAGKAWRSRQPLWATDITQDTRVAQVGLARTFGMRGAFVFPVISEGNAIGVLAFTSREVREPEDRLVQAISIIGSQIGQFMQRKSAEEEQRRFRAAMDVSADAMMLIDRATLRFIDVNYTACKMLGYSRQELLQMGPVELAPVSKVQIERTYDEAIATGATSKQVHLRHRRKDGTWFPVEVHRRAVHSNNRWLIVVNVRDITERLAAEETLRRFRVAMDNSADMIVLVDRAKMRFVDVNETTCRLLGYSREELLEMGPQDLLPVSRGELEQAYDELIANPSLNNGMKSYYRCKDGSLLPFESTRRMLRSGDAYIVVAISRDTSERIAAEEALRRSTERFNTAVRATNDVIWDWDLATDSLWWNENFIKVFGYGRDEVDRTARFWFDRIHPADKDRVVAGIRTIIDTGGESWSDEYRLRRADGSYAYIYDRGHVIRDETGKAVRVIGAMADITVRKEAEERLSYLAQFDSLTGLPNRHLFSDRLAQTLVQAQRYNRLVGVMFIDLDRFKLVNDTLGHGAGDKLLKEVAARLVQCMRSGDTVSRFAGDEFGVVLSDLRNAGAASLVAQKIIDALAEPFNLDGQESFISASIGITLFPGDGEESGALIMNADAAMYRAKEQGRNNYQYFTPKMNTRARERMQTEVALRRAIEHKEFLLHYQPKVNLGTGAICGFEALLRWQHPEKGLVSPVEFISVLEDTGLIVPVGEWVLGEVCRQIQGWQEAGLPAQKVAVNLSARQFQQRDLEATVRRILRDTGTDPSLIQFELTESLLMKEPEVAARALRGLKESGVKVSVDDFGTGYSSLAYLKRFPIDELKIDRAFIRDINTGTDDAAITRAIISLAQTLNLIVVAEGVETDDQIKFLSAHGCDEIQGYVFSKPVSAEDCGRMLREGNKLRTSSTHEYVQMPANPGATTSRRVWARTAQIGSRNRSH